MHTALPLALLLAAFAAVADPSPQALDPALARWFAPPSLPGLRAAWLAGDETLPGPYVLRVKLAAGGRVPPHTHPDRRYTTVLSGTLHVGFGDTMDEAAAIAVPAGMLYEAPAGVPHWVWAREGDVEYQESGSGPTATRMR
ncbi:cupin domain-containing protein [Methyloversatilis thermotolerans]|uniref:cupin domain-containing protein n=1 Tax=Methyloversatilis thermotolerans TaxID=1346290 RepID=UPI00058B4803|nr:cupin domain-containing protein [Methyloversatilis thermotolerans]